MAGDCAPVLPLSPNQEVYVYDGRVALYPEIGRSGWYNRAGSTSLVVPNNSKIKGMTIRGRVAHFHARFSVYIVRVPNGSHPKEWFDSQYTKDSIVKWLHLTPSLNNGYIHHEASRNDINHTVDLINNSYMLRMEMAINRDTVTPGFHDAYLTDIEIRYEKPSVAKRVAIKQVIYTKEQLKGTRVNTFRVPSDMPVWKKK